VINKKGQVILVGAGPGDEDLITVKGKSWIERADVVIYDHLANKNLNQYARQEAEIIYAGKKSGKTTFTQDQINTLLVKKAREGKIVVRLKGGDPFIFGRGGEEAQTLNNAKVPFTIVPGVTSPVGVSAYAGIPLTHRDFASSISIITGSLGSTKGDCQIEWNKVAACPGTLVFLMGARKLNFIVEKLIEHGKPSNTPIAVIQWGTTPKQKTWTGSLSSIRKIISKEMINPPALTIVGEVVKLKKAVDWFEQLPLFGKTIVLTRPMDESEDLKNLLHEKGASSIHFPVIQNCPPDDWEPLDKALSNLSNYDGIFFTSRKGVQYFFDRLRKNSLDVRELKGLEIYAQGIKAKQALETLGLQVTPINNLIDSKTLKIDMGNFNITGNRYLLPRVANAPEKLPGLLLDLGAVLDNISVYQISPFANGDNGFLEAFESGEFDVITLTSKETVNNLHKLIPEDLLPSLDKAVIACIGPATTIAAKSLGLKVMIESKEITSAGLVQAIEQYYA
jgi:uroporphyrinogen III methyltransferase/synthase